MINSGYMWLLDEIWFLVYLPPLENMSSSLDITIPYCISMEKKDIFQAQKRHCILHELVELDSPLSKLK